MAILRGHNSKNKTIFGVTGAIDGRQAWYDLQLPKVMGGIEMLAKFIHSNFTHMDGSKPTVVYSDVPIRDAPTAINIGREFRDKGVNTVYTLDHVWAYPGEIEGFFLQNVAPLGQVIPYTRVCGNSGEYPGNVYNSAAIGMLAENSIFCENLFGQFGLKDGYPKGMSRRLEEMVIDWAIAADTFVSMWGGGYVGFGGASMNMETGAPSIVGMRRHLGLNYVSVDMIELEHRVESGKYDTEAKKMVKWLQKHLDDRIVFEMDREDGKGVESSTIEELQYQCAMYLGIQEITQEYGGIVAGFQGQRPWTDRKPTGCIAEAFGGELVDHRGWKIPVPIATENDVNRGIMLRIATNLSRRPATFIDKRIDYELSEMDQKLLAEAIAEDLAKLKKWKRFIDGCNSGNHVPSIARAEYDMSSAEAYAADVLKEAWLLPVYRDPFPGGGFHLKVESEEKDIIMAGLGKLDDNRLKEIGLLAHTLKFSQQFRDAVRKASSYRWPGEYIASNEKPSPWNCNHAVLMKASKGNELARLHDRFTYHSRLARLPIMGFPSLANNPRLDQPLLAMMYDGHNGMCYKLGPVQH